MTYQGSLERTDRSTIGAQAGLRLFRFPTGAKTAGSGPKGNLMADRHAGLNPERINAGLLQDMALLQAEIQRLHGVVAWCRALLPGEAERAELDREPEAQ